MELSAREIFLHLRPCAPDISARALMRAARGIHQEIRFASLPRSLFRAFTQDGHGGKQPGQYRRDMAEISGTAKRLCWLLEFTHAGHRIAEEYPKLAGITHELMLLHAAGASPLPKSGGGRPIGDNAERGRALAHGIAMALVRAGIRPTLGISSPYVTLLEKAAPVAGVHVEDVSHYARDAITRLKTG